MDAQKAKPFNGIEPWIVEGRLVSGVETTDFVRVLDVRPLDPLDKKGTAYVMYAMIQKRRLADPNADPDAGDSGIRLVKAIFEVEGVKDERDLLRVRRRLEIEANSFNNKTVAKKPGYVKRFENIHLQRESYRHFYKK